jgi:hypothetical protein
VTESPLILQRTGTHILTNWFIEHGRSRSCGRRQKKLVKK